MVSAAGARPHPPKLLVSRGSRRATLFQAREARRSLQRDPLARRNRATITAVKLFYLTPLQSLDVSEQSRGFAVADDVYITSDRAFIEKLITSRFRALAGLRVLRIRASRHRSRHCGWLTSVRLTLVRSWHSPSSARQPSCVLHRRHAGVTAVAGCDSALRASFAAPPRRSDFGTRNRPRSLHQGR